VNFFLTKYN